MKEGYLNFLKEKNKSRCFILGLFVFVLIIVTLGFAIADISDLGNELAQLEGELAGSNYSWLVGYSGEGLYPSVEVYKKDRNIISENKIESKSKIFIQLMILTERRCKRNV